MLEELIYFTLNNLIAQKCSFEKSLHPGFKRSSDIINLFLFFTFIYSKLIDDSSFKIYRMCVERSSLLFGIGKPGTESSKAKFGCQLFKDFLLSNN